MNIDDILKYTAGMALAMPADGPLNNKGPEGSNEIEPTQAEVEDYVNRQRASLRKEGLQMDISDGILTKWAGWLVRPSDDIRLLKRLKEVEAIFNLEEDVEERAALQLVAAYTLTMMSRYDDARVIIDRWIGFTHDRIAYTAGYLDFVVKMRTGGVPPDFEAVISDGQAKGETFKLSSQKGKIVILEFWQTWCGPCRERLTELEKIHDAYNGQVVVIGISDINLEPGREEIARIRRELDISFMQIEDDGKISELYHAMTYPHLVIVEKGGKVAFYRPESNLVDIVKSML